MSQQNQESLDTGQLPICLATVNTYTRHFFYLVYNFHKFRCCKRFFSILFQDIEDLLFPCISVRNVLLNFSSCPFYYWAMSCKGEKVVNIEKLQQRYTFTISTSAAVFAIMMFKASGIAVTYGSSMF